MTGAPEAVYMRYIIPDIHGCLNQYLMLLDKIHFTENIFLVTGHTPTFLINGWGKTEEVVYVDGVLCN